MIKNVFAYHIDLKCAMWTKPYVNAVVDQVAAWGFNAVILEIEDKFRFMKHPSLAHVDAWTAEETRLFADTCHGKGIEVIPLMQSLGHANFVVGKPEYAHLREHPDLKGQYDPLSDQARAVIIELFDELIDAVQPKRFFHIGGDEVAFGRSEKSAAIVKEIGAGELYLRHMRPLFEHVIRRGLRPIIWADIAEAHPKIIPSIPREVVLMDWDYLSTAERQPALNVWGIKAPLTWELFQRQDLPDFKKFFAPYAVDQQTHNNGKFRSMFYTEALTNLGFEVMTASASRCYGDSFGLPNYSRHIPNAFISARKGMTSGAGNTVTSWAVRHNHPELGLPAVFSAAQAVKTKESFNFDAIARSFSSEYFGVELPEIADAFRRAATPIRLAIPVALACGRYHNENKNSMSAAISQLESEFGSREAIIKSFNESLEGYHAALNFFNGLGRRVKRNADKTAYWQEGIVLNIFTAECMLAELENLPSARVSSLMEQAAALKEQTRRLFSATYCPHSVDDEIRVRYDFFDNLLHARAKCD